MATRLILILLAPLLVIVTALLLRRTPLVTAANLIASAVVLVLALPLPFQATPVREFADGYLFIDPLGAWVLLCVAVVYFLASIYSVGYLRHEPRGHTRIATYYALFAGFALTMLFATMVNSVGMYWIAIELTTLVSTFLIGFDRNAESMEAAWKYIIVVSAGISLALLATVLLYWGGTFVLGPSYNLTWATLNQTAPHMPPLLLQMGFLLALIGYGTKAGLAPMHTWLPDAHSEGPAPVSAMLSGALLNTAMLGIVRFLAATDAAGRGRLPHLVLIVLGTLSLLVGALFILRQRGIKRLMAYSSVEHLGVIGLGFGFGGPLGVAGALYQMLNHSLAKSLLFFGAGNAIHRYGSKQIEDIRGAAQGLGPSAWLWLGGAVAITGAPPFGLFLSEFTILRAGWAGPYVAFAVLMLVLLIVIFIGFLDHFRAMYFAQPLPAHVEGHRPDAWSVAPMVLALTALLVLGLWWPAALWHLFAGIATQLGASR